MVKDIIVKINDSATVKSENDVASYSFTVQSKIVQDTKEAYDNILPIMARIKKILSQTSIIEHPKTNYQIDTIWEYEPKRKIIGYQANGYVDFEIKLENGESSNKYVSGLQRNLMNLSNANVKVFLNNIRFTLGEKKRKHFELAAIKKAILYAKRQAQLVVETTYGNSFYTVVKMDVTTNGDNPTPIHREVRSLNVQNDASNVVSQGVSEIKAVVTMEINVNVK